MVYACFCMLLHAGNRRQESARGQAAVLLSDHDRDAFEDMLRGLTAERTSIADVRALAVALLWML